VDRPVGLLLQARACWLSWGASWRRWAMGTWWECGDFNQIGDMGMLMGDMDGYGGYQVRQGKRMRSTSLTNDLR